MAIASIEAIVILSIAGLSGVMVIPLRDRVLDTH
jgi:hypothetical protein